MNEVINLNDRLAAARAKVAAKSPTPPAAPVAPPVPTLPKVDFMANAERTEVDVQLDGIIDGLDIIEAYNRFCGKSRPDPRGRTESIMISCPNPSHPDRDPSAWINTDKQTWFCGGCQEGGDKMDILAWHFGMPVPGYKEGGNFRELRKRTAEALGYAVTRTVAGEFLAEVPQPPVLAPAAATPPPGLAVAAPIPEEDVEPPIVAPPLATVIEMPGEPSGDEINIELELEWRDIVKPNTFLDEWMRCTTIDDVPEEYHFWHGLLALSQAIGRDVTLFDFRPVYGNLFICLLGRSGTGKSKAKYYFDTLMNEVMPFSITDPTDTGSRRISSPGSAEVLIYKFQKRIEDPSTPGRIEDYPVKGVIDFNELASLTGRSSRQGSVLAPTLMQFYDAEEEVATTSLTRGDMNAKKPYACAITTSQPKSLKTLLKSSDASSGFLNRWTYVVGKLKRPTAIGGAVVDITPAIAPLQKVRGWASRVGMMQWDQDAQEAFEEFFHSHIHPTKLDDESDLLNRIDLLCKKLVLLLSVNMMRTTATLEAVEQMKLMFPYIVACYGIPARHVGGSLSNEIQDAILEVVRDFNVRLKVGPTTRDIGQRLRRRKYPLDLFNKILKVMVEGEELEAYNVNAGKRGRPSVRYFIPGVSDVAAGKRAPEAVPAATGTSYFAEEVREDV